MCWAPAAFRHCAKFWGFKGHRPSFSVYRMYESGKRTAREWSQNKPLCKVKTGRACLLEATVTGDVCHPELLSDKPGQNKVTDRGGPPPSSPGLFIIPGDIHPDCGSTGSHLSYFYVKWGQQKGALTLNTFVHQITNYMMHLFGVCL